MVERRITLLPASRAAYVVAFELGPSFEWGERLLSTRICVTDDRRTRVCSLEVRRPTLSRGGAQSPACSSNLYDVSGIPFFGPDSQSPLPLTHFIKSTRSESCKGIAAFSCISFCESFDPPQMGRVANRNACEKRKIPAGSLRAGIVELRTE
jgi:hypothetical protein